MKRHESAFKLLFLIPATVLKIQTRDEENGGGARYPYEPIEEKKTDLVKAEWVFYPSTRRVGANP